MTRREIRDSAFKLIFEKLLRDDPIEDLYELAEDIDEITVDEKVREMVGGVLDHADELDEIIGNYSKNRGIKRIAKIDLAVLRIAVYEMKYDNGTPTAAAIKEAVLLTEAYSYDEDIKFVNGVLSTIAKAFENDSETAKNA